MKLGWHSIDKSTNTSIRSFINEFPQKIIEEKTMEEDLTKVGNSKEYY